MKVIISLFFIFLIVIISGCSTNKLELEIQELQNQNAFLTKQNSDLVQNISTIQTDIRNKEQIIAEKDELITNLQNQINTQVQNLTVEQNCTETLKRETITSGRKYMPGQVVLQFSKDWSIMKSTQEVDNMIKNLGLTWQRSEAQTKYFLITILVPNGKEFQWICSLQQMNNSYIVNLNYAYST